MGHSVFTLYASVPGVLDDVRRALVGEAFTVIQQVGPIAFETWYSPLRDEQGAVSGTIAIATNVTERVEAEAQRLALQGEVIASQEAVQPVAPADTHHTLLVIDDEPEVRQVTARMLERLGYRAVTTTGGRARRTGRRVWHCRRAARSYDARPEW